MGISKDFSTVVMFAVGAALFQVSVPVRIVAPAGDELAQLIERERARLSEFARIEPPSNDSSDRKSGAVSSSAPRYSVGGGGGRDSARQRKQSRN